MSPQAWRNGCLLSMALWALIIFLIAAVHRWGT